MQLFFHPNISKEDTEITFSKEESRHILKVLRKKQGDSLAVTSGSGVLFHSQITSISAQRCVAKIVDVQTEAESPYYLHLAVAPTKMNDRYEWFLEKATEIGIQEITPVICEHSERKVVKLERYQRVLQSAMKQSLHLTLPKINAAVSITEFISLQSQREGDKFIAHCADTMERVSLKNRIQKATRSTILIGPEGDFSIPEIQLALDKGWKPVSLGNSRLRTETAAIVAVHTAALANE